MRIAIPVENGKVAPHLGHCEKFLVVDVEEGKVTNQAELPNPGHGPGGPPPVFVAKLGVNQVVAWGMPPHAQGMFAQMGINVILGATGDPHQVLNDYLAGNLKLTTEGLDAGGSCSHG
ncbi:MAG TPA: NifB/NifX family molybdenum-iron cluster-binding protein [Symbiobacteriaceae bacterium]|jgi:predicted Fe-Mo cluster-binding NifX family protein|nr:NifB/NifX family molybdenum-iron cluster-binding protein [Symbiobacteriaceae bacterium]